MKTVTVSIVPKPKNYDISIGYNYIPKIFSEIVECNPNKKIAIITDSNVKQKWEQRLFDVISKLGSEVFIVDFPAGEQYKTRKTKEELENELFKRKCGRDTVIVALGGGVVGDMAGFVASTYMRGLKYYQIPTTILAQADSSIGGKTAVDVEFGKNLVGAFYHPDKVFIDTVFLTTLDHANYINGLVEVIKHGIIYDKKFFEHIRQNLDAILSRTDSIYETILPEILLQNCNIKKDVVSKDPEERGLRKILNFGHTIGHAVEILSNYNLLHGEAIAIGMVWEAYLGLKAGITAPDAYSTILEIIKALGLDHNIPSEISIEKLYDAMVLDKKSRDGEVEVVLIEEIGKIYENEGYAKRIDNSDFMRILQMKL